MSSLLRSFCCVVRSCRVFGLCVWLLSSGHVVASALTDRPWQEVVISVTDLDRTAEFFREIGGYETRFRGRVEPSELQAFGLEPGATGESLVLGARGASYGFIRLIRFDNAGRRAPMRPGSRTWDTGCYFSLMVRVKGMEAIYDDAIRLGWWTETPIVDLRFKESKLQVVIYRGPDGVQVQAYERLSPPLPAAIPDFERMTQPFNVMQMVRDRDVSYQFFTELLGFETFYKGKPYVAKTPKPTPLGIPVNLTTSVHYQAGIVYPTPGEFGRMEMIEIMDLDGQDYSDRCVAPNLGILSVRYPVDSVDVARARLQRNGAKNVAVSQQMVVPPYGNLPYLSIKTPDGALMQFIEFVVAK